MVMAGKSYREIGETFGVTERTVSRWLAEARTRRLNTFRTTSPEAMLSAMLARLAILDAELIALQDQAAARSDTRSQIEAIRQRRALIRDTAIIGEKVGFFANFQFVPKENQKAPGEAEADWIRGVLKLVTDADIPVSDFDRRLAELNSPQLSSDEESFY
jgi:hypothetical protein